jgi:hypothetical protein
MVSGGYGEGETPLPIPNRAVKPLSADGTWPARAWESRSPPVLISKPRSHLVWAGFCFARCSLLVCRLRGLSTSRWRRGAPRDVCGDAGLWLVIATAANVKGQPPGRHRPANRGQVRPALLRPRGRQEPAPHRGGSAMPTHRRVRAGQRFRARSLHPGSRSAPQ